MRTGIYGFAISGPAMHYWYKFVDKMIPPGGLAKTLQRVFLDQTVFAPFVISTFFLSTGLMEGKTPDQLYKNILGSGALWEALLVNWSVWPFAQAVNYGLVPQQHRVLFVSCVSVAWNTYLCSAK